MHETIGPWAQRLTSYLSHTPYFSHRLDLAICTQMTIVWFTFYHFTSCIAKIVRTSRMTSMYMDTL
jgi:hypothetical protein